MRRNFEGGLKGTKTLNRLSNNLASLVGKIFQDLNYSGNCRKPYENRGRVLPGEGPFVEFLVEGNKKRVILDESNSIIYVTMDHHRSYFEVD